MMVVDMYRPDQWHDFFVMVGGGSAALTGLVFVALSLNLESIEWLVVSTFAAVMYVYGYIQALKTGRSAVGLRAEERSRQANVCSVRRSRGPPQPFWARTSRAPGDQGTCVSMHAELGV